MFRFSNIYRCVNLLQYCMSILPNLITLGSTEGYEPSSFYRRNEGRFTVTVERCVTTGNVRRHDPMKYAKITQEYVTQELYHTASIHSRGLGMELNRENIPFLEDIGRDWPQSCTTASLLSNTSRDPFCSTTLESSMNQSKVARYQIFQRSVAEP